jgi:hypothetical protein
MLLTACADLDKDIQLSHLTLTPYKDKKIRSVQQIFVRIIHNAIFFPILKKIIYCSHLLTVIWPVNLHQTLLSPSSSSVNCNIYHPYHTRNFSLMSNPLYVAQSNTRNTHTTLQKCTCWIRIIQYNSFHLDVWQGIA